MFNKNIIEKQQFYDFSLAVLREKQSVPRQEISYIKPYSLIWHAT
jgi:hypothetical protein